MPDCTAYIGLGANLGDAPSTLRGAIRSLNALPGTEVAQSSALYRSAPVDASGPDFYNAVVVVRTAMTPHALLAALQAIESAAGRERPYRNAPRTLDLDILWIDGVTLNSPELVVPHPRMHERAFVLLPLADIAPALVPPSLLVAVGDQRIERLDGVGLL
jgi:2-amino-4-hydroxy-6-hydroxymethyldihydropteridine diphosphokinase